MEILPALLLALVLVALLVVPFGLPGHWVIAGVVAFGWIQGWTPGSAAVLIWGVGCVVVEVVEFWSVKAASDRYGGTRRDFWAAIGGGLVGGLVGTPVPVVGSILGLLVGTFGGAALSAYGRARDLDRSVEVGVGAVLGRVVAVGTKTLLALAMTVHAALMLGGAAFG